ncbi:TetR/AcrR family transcriptional regulator [Kitasatospora arboriphila]
MPERRRGAALEKALLDAAWEELTANGYARFTMDAVGRRAGTSPPVLYRRWADRDELVRAAIAHVLEESRIDAPDTGSLREDVLTLMRTINATRVQLVTVMSVHLA